MTAQRLVITNKASDKDYFMKLDLQIVKNEVAIRCIFEYLKTFPTETNAQTDYFNGIDKLTMPYIRT